VTAPRRPTPTSPPVVPPVIVVIDDEPEILKALERELRRSGDVRTFTDPALAFAAVHDEEHCAAVIADLRMPAESGVEFLARCSEVKPDVQRILLTAFPDLVDVQESVNRARINLFLSKPWEADDLREAVEYHLRVFELRQENQNLRRLALMDGLTGVANHRYFWDRLEAELSRAQRHGRPLSLILADVDDFKKYNDTHGHLRGDEVLRQVAQALERERRSSDLVARYGGEEFGILLPEVTRAVAMEIAQRHLDRVARESGIHLSLGVAEFPTDATTSTELVDRADKALYRAKATGKGRAVSAGEGS
jgi:two-component system cell cycle response regulator